MQIRQAKATDIPAIQQVARESWHSAYAAILQTETVENVLAEFYSEESLSHSLQRRAVIFLVAEVDEQVVAFVQALPRPGSNDYELTRLYVLPSHQRQGIGRQLLQTVENQLHGHRLWVLVEQDNQAAFAFFVAMGYKMQRLAELPIFGENLPFAEMSK